MSLGLGIGISRQGGPLNPDGLSLDLAFALDKTLTARKGPTPTFTRASTATQVGSTGLIEFAPENLNSRSEEFENAVYGRAGVGVAAATITANNDTAPDGTLTADLVSFSATTAINQQGMLFRTVHTATIGQVVTLSIFLRVPSGTATIFIGLSEGSPQTGQSVACNVTTTWQRFSVTRTALAATAIFIELGPDTRAFMGQTAVQPAASVLLWGAQFERHGSARPYLPTTTAAVFGPRFDHDPVTLDCRGLLIEEQRTNLVPRSSNFPAGSWSINAGRLTMALNATGPDGTLSATTLTATGLSGAAFIVNSVPLIIGTTFTHSAILKAGTSSFAGISSFDGALAYGAMFNLTTGTFVGLRTDGTLGTVTATSIINLGNGFFRCSMTYVSTGTSNSFTNQILISEAGNLNFGTPCTAGTSIIAFAYQLEIGAFPTSYIPTTTAALTRSADVCSITGANFTSFYNQSEGTLVTGYSSFTNSQVLPSKRGITMSDSTTANRLAFANIPSDFTFAGLSMIFLAISGGAAVAILGETGLDTTTLNTISGAYKINDFASSTNGSAVVTDTSGAVPVGINKIDIGNQLSSEFLNGHIARFQYFRKRLSNAKLITLTT